MCTEHVWTWASVFRVRAAPRHIHTPEAALQVPRASVLAPVLSASAGWRWGDPGAEGGGASALESSRISVSPQGRMSRWKCVRSAAFTPSDGYSAAPRVSPALPTAASRERRRPSRAPPRGLRIAEEGPRLESRPSPPRRRGPVSRFQGGPIRGRGAGTAGPGDAAGTAVAGYRFSGCKQLLVLLTA